MIWWGCYDNESCIWKTGKITITFLGHCVVTGKNFDQISYHIYGVYTGEVNFNLGCVPASCLPIVIYLSLFFRHFNELAAQQGTAGFRDRAISSPIPYPSSHRPKSPGTTLWRFFSTKIREKYFQSYMVEHKYTRKKGQYVLVSVLVS